MRWRNLKGCLVLGVIFAAWAVGLLAGRGEQFLGRLQPLGRDFLIIAHRGAPNQVCENTLESFAQALQVCSWKIVVVVPAFLYHGLMWHLMEVLVQWK